jgi:dihydroorotate dehydrogenase (NAD+) catalytic subunit
VGASAVQVGTANFMNPSATVEILDGIQDFMKKEKIYRLKDLVGSIQT